MRAAAAERDVVVRLPPQVEPVRIGEDLLVVVRRDVPERELVALPDRRAADLGVASGRAAEVDDRRPEAEDLLDRGGQERRVGREPLELVRVLHEGEDALGDPGSRRLVAGKDEDLEEVRVLRVGEALAVHLRVDEPGDEVAGRVMASLLADLPAVLEDVPGGRASEGKEARVDVGRVLDWVGDVVGVGRRRQLARPLDQLGRVLCGKPEDRDQDHDWQRLRDRRHPVELALGNRFVEELARDAARVGPVLAHLLRSEHGADELPQARVRGRIGLDHRLARRERVRLAVLESDVADLGGERLRVLADLDDVGVLRQEPEAASVPGPRVPVHRILGPQAREHVVRGALAVDRGARHVDVRQILLHDRHPRSHLLRSVRPSPSQSALVDSTWRTIASRARPGSRKAIAPRISRCSPSAIPAASRGTVPSLAMR